MNQSLASVELAQAAKLLPDGDRLLTILNKPKRILKKELTITRDNGQKERFMGIRVQHNDLLGPFKGGIRFHPSVSVEEVTTLSLLMTLKCALMGLPLGGSKGGSPQSLPLADFTVLLSTTDEFNLLQPLRDRMRLTLRFEY